MRKVLAEGLSLSSKKEINMITGPAHIQKVKVGEIAFGFAIVTLSSYFLTSTSLISLL